MEETEEITLREVDDVKRNCPCIGQIHSPSDYPQTLDLFLDDTNGNWHIYCIGYAEPSVRRETKQDYEVVRVLGIVA